MWGDIAIAFTLAFLATLMLTPLTIKLARHVGAVDTPNDVRRMNKVTMPRLGGLAVIGRIYNFCCIFVNNYDFGIKNRFKF